MAEQKVKRYSRNGTKTTVFKTPKQRTRSVTTKTYPSGNTRTTYERSLGSGRTAKGSATETKLNVTSSTRKPGRVTTKVVKYGSPDSKPRVLSKKVTGYAGSGAKASGANIRQAERQRYLRRSK